MKQRFPLHHPIWTVIWLEQGINLHCVLSHQNLILKLFVTVSCVNYNVVLPWIYFSVLCWKVFDLKVMNVATQCTYASFCPIKNLCLLLYLFLVESQGPVLSHWPTEHLSEILWSHMCIKTTHKQHNLLERWIVPGVYSASEICLGICFSWA